MPGLAGLLTKASAAAKSKFDDFYLDVSPLVKNADGKPTTYYHGTQGNFDVFEHGKSGGNVRANSGQGFYVTSDPEKAALYGNAEHGGNVVPLHANVKSPYPWPPYKDGVATHPTHNRMTPMDQKLEDELRAKGYDSIIGKRSPDELIVFNSNQLKSVHNMAPTASSNVMRVAVPGGLAAEAVRRGQMQRLEAEDKPLENQLLGF